MLPRVTVRSLSLVVVLASPLLLRSEPSRVELRVPAGTPLHVTIPDKTVIRAGEPVRAVTTHAVYAFDREVLPAGAVVTGRVAEVLRPNAKQRAQVYLAGQLRLKKEALIELDSVELADGSRVAIETVAAKGAPGVIRLTARADAPSEAPPQEKTGLTAKAKEKAKTALAQNELAQALRSPSEAKAQGKKAASAKWRGVRNAFLAYWPLGRQHIRAGSAFTAELAGPLDFGGAEIDPRALDSIGAPPPGDAVVEARLLETVSSDSAQVGAEIRAEVTRPLLSEDGKLMWPQGAVIVGEVSQATPARRFGRNGQLRFRFTRLEMPSGVTQLVAASLDAAEVDSRSRMELDSEGGVTLKTSKKRFVMPALSAVAMMTGVPGDEDGVPTGSAAQGMAPGWFAVGPWGSLIALSSRAAAAPLGVMGTASSVYFNLVRKADELEFPKHTRLEIRFGRPAEETLQEAVPAAETRPARGLATR